MKNYFLENFREFMYNDALWFLYKIKQSIDILTYTEIHKQKYLRIRINCINYHNET
jgi:hypothetical protein